MSERFKSLFENLHAQYLPMVHNMCMGFMKGDKDLANDLTQEVFMNIWNALSGFREEASHKTWIYRITVNTCLQHIRKEKKRKHTTIDEMDHPQEDQEISDYNNLYQAIGQLNEIDRLTIMMVLDEVEYDEISRVLGINAINLRVKIHRIKNRLKKMLEHE